jgi:hypothetical protein
MGIGSSIGSLAGGLGGFFIGNPALGSAVGSAAGSLIEGIPQLIETDAERENKRRLKSLQLREKMGQLGLTEAEKQQLFSSAQNQIAGQLATSRNEIRAAGAAGMGGAGAAALQQAAAAENQASLLGSVGLSVEGKNLERKRELEDEIQARIAAKSEEQLAVAGALTKPVSAGVSAYMEEGALQKEIAGGYGRGAKDGGTGIGKGADGMSMLSPAQKDAIKKAFSLTSDEELQAFIEFQDKFPEAKKYDASVTGETK